MPPTRLKAKPLMIYPTESEKKQFSKLAKRHNISMSRWIINAAQSYINGSTIGIEQDDRIVIGLRAEIAKLEAEIIELKTPSIGFHDEMADRIYNYIKKSGTWVTDKEIHNLFDITNEGEHTDVLIGMHKLQIYYSEYLEFSEKFGWKWKQ